MYTFDKETKSIVTPDGKHLKGKAVTEHLNQLADALVGMQIAMSKVIAVWQGLNYIMNEFDDALGIGAEDVQHGEDGEGHTSSGDAVSPDA